MTPRGEGGGAAREGAALLQGLVRCGRCGRKMQVAYSGANGKVRRYTCVRGRDSHATGKACQTVGGARLDKTVGGAFLEAAAPAGIAATAGAIRELEEQHEQRLGGQRLALERAQYEADRAHRKFDACEPENRLVGRTLERTLEEALANLERDYPDAGCDGLGSQSLQCAVYLDCYQKTGGALGALDGGYGPGGGCWNASPATALACTAACVQANLALKARSPDAGCL